MLLFVIVICAIVMLFFKPSIMGIMSSLSRNKKPEGHKYQGFIEEEEDANEPQQQHSVNFDYCSSFSKK